ncbi:hypothetical protein ACFQX6_43230 [Streptosporangium lutulentum]
MEGGVGWLPMLAERADYALDHPVAGEASWEGGLKPSEVLRRNFFFERSTTTPCQGCASPSAWSTSCWRAVTRIPTRPGPTPSRPS